MSLSVNYALTLSSPLLVSFGSLLRIPLNLGMSFQNWLTDCSATVINLISFRTNLKNQTRMRLIKLSFFSVHSNRLLSSRHCFLKLGTGWLWLDCAGLLRDSPSRQQSLSENQALNFVFKMMLKTISWLIYLNLNPKKPRRRNWNYQISALLWLLLLSCAIHLQQIAFNFMSEMKTKFILGAFQSFSCSTKILFLPFSPLNFIFRSVSRWSCILSSCWSISLKWQ